MPHKHPDRAPYGSLAGEPGFLLRAPSELREEAKRLAAKEGITEAEWWRRAGRERALRQNARK